MIPNHLLRHAGIVPLEVMGEEITIIGAGAIGSFTVLQLAKVGFGNIRVFDFDKVEDVNLGSQFYRFSDVGVPKVEALKNLVYDFTKIRIEGINAKYEGGMFPGIVISAVDSMKVRKLIFDEHREKSHATRAIIDPRMGAETALLYTVLPMNKADCRDYEKTLYTDERAESEPCTEKSTIYCANMLSGLVVKTVKDIVTKKSFLKSAAWSIKENDFMPVVRMV